MLVVSHVISGLQRGGAEMMLCKLVERHVHRSMTIEVISLTDEGNLGEWIRRCGVAVYTLGMKRGVADPRAVLRLIERWRSRRPDVIQTWMYHADLIGGVAAKLSGSPPLIWGVRQSNLAPAHNKRLTLLTATLCAKMSRWLPKRIVCCSEAAAQAHIRIGYDRQKIVVIPNGFDLHAYRALPSVRASVRAELGILEAEPVIGMIARFDPQKDHKTFIDAAAILRQRLPSARFVLVGDGMTFENRQLVEYLESRQVIDRFFLLGRRDDIVRILNTFDIASLSSLGEGFPNVIGEAMACEVPCIVTNAGDSALLVGNSGKVVPIGDAVAMAEAWAQLLKYSAEERRALGAAARARIKQYFDIEVVAERYATLYTELAQPNHSS